MKEIRRQKITFGNALYVMALQIPDRKRETKAEQRTMEHNG